MLLHVITDEVLSRATKLTESPYRPAPIRELKEQIDAKTRVLELRSSVGKPVTQAEIEEIVGLKLHLDTLYADWLEGRLS